MAPPDVLHQVRRQLDPVLRLDDALVAADDAIDPWGGTTCPTLLIAITTIIIIIRLLLLDY